MPIGPAWVARKMSAAPRKGVSCREWILTPTKSSRVWGPWLWSSSAQFIYTVIYIRAPSQSRWLGECRVSKSLMALARKAHANLLGGAECPSRGTLKAVLQALAGVDEVPSEADTASQADEPTEAVEALCDKLAADALSKVESMLVNAVRARYAHEKDRMVESALQAIADEG